MKLEEAKERLKSLKENVFVLDCHAIDTVIAELHSMQNLLDEMNEELDRLQKENEELKEIDLTTVHIKGVCDERERWRNKIREKIEEIESVYSKRVYDRKYDRDKVKAERFYKTEVLNDLLKEEGLYDRVYRKKQLKK